MAESKLLLVDTAVLPEVYGKVVEAKRLLAVGRVKNLSEAAKKAGISRSALYKYKDYVFMYNAGLEQNVVTLSATLEDRPGVLSGLINAVTRAGANILTVNQNIPSDGVAPVSVSAQLEGGVQPEDLLRQLRLIEGVVEIKIPSGR